MQESISFGKDLRREIKKTTKILSKAVKSTLGPSGTNVGVLSEISLPMIVNDGATVAKKVVFKDPLRKYIANILKTVSQNTDNIAGDGTTTATTLAEAIILEGIKHIEAGFSQIGISAGIREATLLVLKELESKAIDILEDKKILLHVASVSANNDKQLGKLISDAFLKVGADGQIEVKDSVSDKTYIEEVNGMKFNSGFESNMFVNTDKSEVHLDDCRVLLYEGKLTSIDPIIDSLKEARTNNTSLLIIADDYSVEAINDLTYNKINAKVKICAVRSPGYGMAKEHNMEDIADVTGATIISKRVGSSIDEFNCNLLGKASSANVDANSFSLINSGVDKAIISKKISNLKIELKKESSIGLKSELLNRIAKLSNGVVVMYVSANSPVELVEKKYRIEDAINATRAALEEGVIPGGGVALLRIGEELKRTKLSGTSQEIGFNILLKALRAPIKTICDNSGSDSSIVIFEVLKSKNFNYGYDARIKKYKNLVTGGVVDPLKVTKAALTNASSVSQMLLTMNCAIY